MQHSGESAALGQGTPVNRIRRCETRQIILGIAELNSAEKGSVETLLANPDQIRVILLYHLARMVEARDRSLGARVDRMKGASA